ncbi:glycosyltransferase [Desulforamulus aquiferis]|uniref:Glycosyltransferase n=1 Tax=Desulforamulus aquiferis TaxID=1397668 RepID=A0AAW7ZBE7_9FIRM|nr:glycosyltransferase [Desulforamulus aquiferis]
MKKEKENLDYLVKSFEQDFGNVTKLNYDQRKFFKIKFIELISSRKRIIDLENSTKYVLLDTLLESLTNPVKAPRKILFFSKYFFSKAYYFIRKNETKLPLRKIILSLLRPLYKKINTCFHGRPKANLVKNTLIMAAEDFQPKRKDITIGVIMDKFSYDCFKYEANLVIFTPENWKEVLSNNTPDFLLVESAWRGNNNSWMGYLNDLGKVEDSRLFELVNWCKDKNIKTVFWNKEDPPHFERFITAAKLFDYVFTTDIDCVPRYKGMLGHERVFCLPFGAQPKIHNPIGSKPKVHDVAFAGSWYEKNHDARKRQMKYMLEPAFKYKLHIFDRNYSRNNDTLRFPEKYMPFIVGEASYQEINYIYKIYKVFLNVNSVSASPTMFSRRVFEILASGTCVVSSYSKGIDEILGSDLVKMSNSWEETKRHLDQLIKDEAKRERLAHLGVRMVLQHHTYSNRLKYIIDNIDLNTKDSETSKREITIVAYANSEESINSLLESYSRQEYAEKEMILLLDETNLNGAKWERLAQACESITITKVDKTIDRQEWMHKALEVAKYEYIAVFDGACFYGKHYLGDLNMAFDFTDASIVGKGSYYTYFEDEQALALNNRHMNHCYTPLVLAEACIIKKEVFSRLKAKTESNQAQQGNFLTDCASEGFKIYSADRYNFVQIQKGKATKLADYEIVNYSKDYINQIEI